MRSYRDLTPEQKEIARFFRRAPHVYHGTAADLAAEIGGEYHPLLLGRILTALQRVYPRNVFKKRVHNRAYYTIRFFRRKEQKND